MDSVLNTFIAEAEELLADMESSLLRIGEGECNSEILDEIFRAAHTIKGSAGLFGLNHIVDFTHKVESVLDLARDKDIVIDDQLLGILLKCGDHIAQLVQLVVDDADLDDQQRNQGVILLNSLSPWLNDTEDDCTSVENSTVARAGEEEEETSGVWHISLRMGEDALRNGMDPMSIFRYLESMGSLTYLMVVDEKLAVSESFDPESLYLGFELGLETVSSRDEIESAFMFVREEADINIIPPNSAVDEYVSLIKSILNGESRLGEMLVECGATTALEIQQALSEQADRKTVGEAKASLGEILVETNSVPSEVVDAALDQQKKSRNAAIRFIRVDADRLDGLITLIGELVINQQRVDLLTENIESAELNEAVHSLGGFTEQIRDAALTLRMVQIGETFQRFKRVVRDTAADLGKSIELVVEGEETELDRSMVEKLTDPLTHIVRNSIDHGIEASEVRVARGKPPTGTIKLSAYHESGNIVLEISDDGGGLSADKIRNKAIANGIIDESQSLSDHEIHQLIFNAGLSTAEEVTNLSGRGVGMDVVRRNIESLQGAIDIDSRFEQGTTLKIRLPLTLAIIDGFHVECKGAHFIIPQATIVECMDFDTVENLSGRNSVNIRGELVPYIPLEQLFSLSGDDSDHTNLVVVQFGNERAAIVVDALHGETQTVVKPMSPIFQSLRGVGGSSLLGSGDIAFILDVPQLIAFAVEAEIKVSRDHQGACYDR